MPHNVKASRGRTEKDTTQLVGIAADVMSLLLLQVRSTVCLPLGSYNMLDTTRSRKTCLFLYLFLYLLTASSYQLNVNKNQTSPLSLKNEKEAR